MNMSRHEEESEEEEEEEVTAGASAPATFVVLAAPSRNLVGLCLCSGDFL